MLELMAFYAVRGVPLDVLAAATPAERGFLQGARALYYEEQAALLQAAGARDYLEKLLQREIRALEGMQSGSAVDRAVLDGQREIVRVIKQAWEELA